MKYFVCAPADSKNGTNGENHQGVLLPYSQISLRTERYQKNTKMLYWSILTFGRIRGEGGGGEVAVFSTSSFILETHFGKV